MKLTHFPQVINGQTFQYEAVEYVGEYTKKKKLPGNVIEYTLKDGSTFEAYSDYALTKSIGFKILAGSPDYCGGKLNAESFAELTEKTMVYSNCDEFCSDEYITLDEVESKKLYCVANEPAPYDPNNEDDQEPMEIENDHGADIILVHM